jgi:hypothetical protein
MKLREKRSWTRRLGIMTMVGVVLLIALPVFAQSAEEPAGADSSRGDEQARTRIDIENLFTPSGWMGDGEYGREYLDFQGASTENPHSPPTCIKIVYRFGPQRWAGIYWQNESENWGALAGYNYAKKGFSTVTFWARGETGTEVIEFKSEGIRSAKEKHRDSYSKTIGRVTLTKQWNEYRIPLEDLDLTSVIGAFCWVARQDYNPGKKVTFFLDDIVME